MYTSLPRSPAHRGSARIENPELRSLATRVFASRARDMGELVATSGDRPHRH